jgi:hypothetical protein
MVHSHDEQANVSRWLRRGVYAIVLVALAAAGACDDGILLPEPEAPAAASVVMP